MSDTRFTTVCDDLENLLATVDVDEIGDIETLMMFLFDRPIAVSEGDSLIGGPEMIEFTIDGRDDGVCFGLEFPMSVVEFVRSCADDVSDLGPYAVGGDEPDVAGMSEEELVAALQQALGQVRIYNLMNADE
jgi:hypothetical protein